MTTAGVFSFEWDQGNIAKTQKRFPIEEVELFFNQTLDIKEDKKNSKVEQRFFAVGYSTFGKPMYVCFTIRGTREHPKIRVISCRLMHKKETLGYEIFQKNKKEV